MERRRYKGQQRYVQKPDRGNPLRLQKRGIRRVVVDLKVFEISFIRGSVYSIKEPLKVKVFFDDQYRAVIFEVNVKEISGDKT